MRRKTKLQRFLHEANKNFKTFLYRLFRNWAEELEAELDSYAIKILVQHDKFGEVLPPGNEVLTFAVHYFNLPNAQVELKSELIRSTVFPDVFQVVKKTCEENGFEGARVVTMRDEQAIQSWMSKDELEKARVVFEKSMRLTDDQL